MQAGESIRLADEGEKGGKEIKRERGGEKQDEKQSGQELIQLCKEEV